jgi:citrate synthase
VLIAEGASFADLMIKVVLGRRIEGPERRIINAALISGAEYSETAASSSITRLMASTDASAVETYRSLISTFGYYHLGALKESARIIERAAKSSDLEAAIEASIVYDAVEQPGKAPRGRVAGFGHRFQHRDPRAALLLEMCGRLFPGRFVETAAALDRRLFERRVGHINMDGIGAAMGLQVGFTAEVTSLLTLIARAPGIAKEYARVLAAPRTFSLKERAGLF